MNKPIFNEKKKICSIFRWVLAFLALIVILSYVGFKFYASNYYRADNIIINIVNNISDDKVHTFSDKDGMVFIPQQEYKAVIVFYPGGRVEYTAYSTLLYRLAARGFICILPKMPDNLAFLKVDAVEKLGRGHKEEKDSVSGLDWYIAGHSLGGVAAATYLDQDHENNYKGIILCASYITSDLSDDDLRLLSIYGSEDKVMNMNSYNENKKNWPEDSEEHILDGGIHSYFGSYGIQSGDGVPTISNEEQLDYTADIISEWIIKSLITE